MRTGRNRAAIAVAAAFLIVACMADDAESHGQPNPAAPAVIATNLTVPWGIAFLPDGTALVAERNSGAVSRLSAPGALAHVGDVAGVAARGEAGLLGLAVSPGYATDQTVFAYFTAAGDNRVVRMRFDGQAITERHPRRLDPRWRTHRVRSRRQALRRDRRERQRRAGAGPVVAGRQDSSHQSRRVGSGG